MPRARQNDFLRVYVVYPLTGVVEDSNLLIPPDCAEKYGRNYAYFRARQAHAGGIPNYIVRLLRC
jgi:hypothetical protein